MTEQHPTAIDPNTNTADRHQQTLINFPHDRRQVSEGFHRQILQNYQLELKQAKERYRQLFDLSPIAYALLTPKGQIADINLSAARLLGGERQSLANLPFARLISGHENKRWQDAWSLMQKNAVKTPIEINLIRMDDTPLLVKIEKLANVSTGFDTSNYLLAITDISPCKQLPHLPDLAAMAFEIQEGVMITDAESVIQQINPAFTRITGYNIDEAVGKTPRLLSSGLQSLQFYQAMWQHISHQGYWQGEIWNRRKNGEIFPEWLTISAVLDSTNGQKLYIGSFTDISAYKQKELQTLEIHQQRELQLQLALQQKNAELQQIKTELNDINTTLKVLNRHQQTDALKAKEAMGQEVSQEVIPFLHQLKRGSHNDKQNALIDILETNLQKISASYGNKNSISRLFQELTPKEIQIASMIRQGLPTKYIAATLSLSEATINAHRKNIRKKLGVDNKSINLQTYLMAFD